MAWSKSAFFAIGLTLAFVASNCANSSVTPTDGGSDATPIGPCGPGTAVKCGNRCVDPKIDPYNCGGCNKACDGGQSCVNSTCQ